MLSALREALAQNPQVSTIIISIAFMLLFGFAMTRITKLLKLPNVTAYILAGILIGPYCLGLVPQRVIDGMDFLSDIALAFIAFSTGEFFRLSTLKKSGARVMVITVLEALASATAPASTVMTIRQTGAKGDFVDTLLQVVALDDIVGLVAYSIAISVAVSSKTGTGAFHIWDIVKPLLINLGVFALGGVFGVLMKLMMPKKRSTDNRLIISVALLFSFCGICTLLDISPLLGCMSMGTVYINISDDDKLFKQLNYFSPPILLLFFVRSGMNFKLDVLISPSGAVGTTPLLVIGVLYFLFRIVGKYAGAFLGCLAVGKPKQTRNFLGLALIPQAGVAIGLAALGARTLGGEDGVALNTIILASSVLYELIGPACAKLSLYLSGSYSTKLEDLAPVDATTPTGETKSEVELLIERIRKIQETIPPHELHAHDEEQAFTEAAEEQYAAEMLAHRGHHGRR